jgi:hypothetical protein
MKREEKPIFLVNKQDILAYNVWATCEEILEVLKEIRDKPVATSGYIQPTTTWTQTDDVKTQKPTTTKKK